MIHGKSKAEHLGAFPQGGVSNFISAQWGLACGSGAQGCHSRAAEMLSSHTSGMAQTVMVIGGLRRPLEQ